MHSKLLPLVRFLVENSKHVNVLLHVKRLFGLVDRLEPCPESGRLPQYYRCQSLETAAILATSLPTSHSVMYTGLQHLTKQCSTPVTAEVFSAVKQAKAPTKKGSRFPRNAKHQPRFSYPRRPWRTLFLCQTRHPLVFLTRLKRDVTLSKPKSQPKLITGSKPVVHQKSEPTLVPRPVLTTSTKSHASTDICHHLLLKLV